MRFFIDLGYFIFTIVLRNKKKLDLGNIQLACFFLYFEFSRYVKTHRALLGSFKTQMFWAYPLLLRSGYRFNLIALWPFFRNVLFFNVHDCFSAHLSKPCYTDYTTAHISRKGWDNSGWNFIFSKYIWIKSSVKFIWKVVDKVKIHTQKHVTTPFRRDSDRSRSSYTMRIWALQRSRFVRFLYENRNSTVKFLIRSDRFEVKTCKVCDVIS